MPEILETNPTTTAAPPAKDNSNHNDDSHNDKLECVGSLLVHTQDVQELSSSPSSSKGEGMASNLRRRFTEAMNAPPPKDDADLDPRDWLD